MIRFNVPQFPGKEFEYVKENDIHCVIHFNPLSSAPAEKSLEDSRGRMNTLHRIVIY